MSLEQRVGRPWGRRVPLPRPPAAESSPSVAGARVSSHDGPLVRRLQGACSQDPLGSCRLDERRRMLVPAELREELRVNDRPPEDLVFAVQRQLPSLSSFSPTMASSCARRRLSFRASFAGRLLSTSAPLGLRRGVFGRCASWHRAAVAFEAAVNWLPDKLGRERLCDMALGAADGASVRKLLLDASEKSSPPVPPSADVARDFFSGSSDSSSTAA